MNAKPFLAASLLLLAACNGDKDGTSPDADTDTDDTSAAAPLWEEAFDTSTAGALSGVWGSGPDDVFIVGGTDTQAEIYHYDGTDWSPMTAPAVPLLVWSYGFGSDDVFSVGLDGAVVHYDGTAWTELDSGVTDDLWGVFGFANDDLWIVGGTPDVGEPVLLHYDGSTFTPHPLDAAQNSRGATAMFKVWGIDGALFSVGQRGLMLTWDGTEWIEAGAGATADQDFVSLWGTSATNMVAVGGRSNARISEYDGTAWSTQAPSALGGLNAISMLEPDFAIIGGVNGFLGSFEPSTDTIIQEDVLTTHDIHAIWGDGTGRYWAVGGRFLSPFEGTALVRNAP